jgi:surface protein
MFLGSLFNKPIDMWDMSNNKNMGHMFAFSRKFNKPLNNWDTSSVINMSAMFAYAKEFN